MFSSSVGKMSIEMYITQQQLEEAFNKGVNLWEYCRSSGLEYFAFHFSGRFVRFASETSYKCSVLQ